MHKRERMLASGPHPYPVPSLSGVPRTRTLREIRDAHVGLPPDTVTDEKVAVTGRVIFLHNIGKLCFSTLREGDGTELQAMLTLADVGADGLATRKATSASGITYPWSERWSPPAAGSCRELSVQAREWRMAAKALRPLPPAHQVLAEETSPPALPRSDRSRCGPADRPGAP
jgi:lysyl-tRNA synthetase class 2